MARFLALALFITLVCAPGCGDRDADPPRGQPNVLLILIDTLRADGLGCYGGTAHTPVIDGLAARGTRFENAIAQSSWTTWSVASLLTSRWPLEALRPDGRLADVPTLASHFAASGYATGAFVANALLEADRGYGIGFQTYWSPTRDEGFEFKWTDARQVTERAGRWLKDREGEPFFLYAHYLDPHSPYCPPRLRPEGPDSPVPGDMSPLFFTPDLLDEETVATWRPLYDQEIEWADQWIGVLLDQLDPETERETILVVVSDHGEEFLDHGFVGHGWSLFETLTRVPLVVAGPGIEAGRAVAPPVALVDLLPTLLSLAGITPEGRLEGNDLSGILSGEADSPPARLIPSVTTQYGLPLRASARAGRFSVKLFDEAAEDGDPSPHQSRIRETVVPVAVFDLEADPRERSNLVDRTDHPHREEIDQLIERTRRQAYTSYRGHAPGVWIAFRGTGGGGAIQGEIVVEDTPQTPRWFLRRPGDELRRAGLRVTFSATDDGSLRAIHLPGRGELRVSSIRVSGPSGPLVEQEEGIPAPGTWVGSLTDTGVSPETPTPDQLEALRALGYVE